MKKTTDRRAFLKLSAGLAGLGLTVGGFLKAAAFPSFAGAHSGPANIPGKNIPLLSFSTLGCPDWTFARILDFAAGHGYKGIELRGILRQLDLTKCPEFSSPESIAASRKLAESKGLSFVDLGSSAELHHADPVTRKNNLDEAKRFIDLAEQLGCPNVRVFPNKLPKDQDRNMTIGLIISGLKELGEYARNTHVRVLMESHGELVHSDDLKRIMEASAGKHVGMVWDIFNMWSATKESPSAVYADLKKYIHHTHIKDGKLSDGKIQLVLLGKGESPIFEAIDILSKDGYKGFYSFEWEKLWNPEIEEPEIALADFPIAIKKHFEAKG